MFKKTKEMKDILAFQKLFQTHIRNHTNTVLQ